MDELTRSLERVDAILADLADEEKQVAEAIENIELDLANSAEAFVATTGKSKEEFYVWRKRASAARLFKQRRLNKVRELRRDAEADRARVQMLLLADKTGYRGQDPLKLLDALYLLTMEVLDRSGVQLDEHETGLLMAVRLQCGYGAPGERVT